MPQEIFQGVAVQGGIAERLLAAGGDVNVLRPYLGEDGRSYVTVNTGRRDNNDQIIYEAVPTVNAATLRKDEWSYFDQVVVREARKRLRAWADLRSANEFGNFDGMASMVLESEAMSDPGEAQVDFDGLSESNNASPLFQPNGLPLAITHSDFFFSLRRLLMSRRLGTPLDSSLAEAAGRRVAEEIEKTTIGTVVGPSLSPSNVSIYNRTPKVYGYTNHPSRVTKTDITAPTTGGWTPATFIDELGDLIESLNDNGFYGPFMMYHSTSWSKYFDQDYSDAKGDNTLRDRIRKNEQIQDVRRLDYLTSGYQIVLVQMTPDVARAVVGLDFTVVQWQSKGGLRYDFKVMTIQVPQLRDNYSGDIGIGHGTTS